MWKETNGVGVFLEIPRVPSPVKQDLYSAFGKKRRKVER